MLGLAPGKDRPLAARKGSRSVGHRWDRQRQSLPARVLAR